MTNDILATSDPIASILESSNADRGKQRKSNSPLGQQEFLTLLVEQLKSQDPLNPMQNEEFAVQLAQFSQLEQLISLNDKLGSSTTSTMSGLAGFLGQQVTLPGATVRLEEGAGPSLKVEAPDDMVATKIELLNESGEVVLSEDVGALPKGEHTLNFSGISVPDGDYTYRVLGTNQIGQQSELPARTVGTVTGFVPGPEPILIVDGREVPLNDITRVDYLPPTSPPSGNES